MMQHFNHEYMIKNKRSKDNKASPYNSTLLPPSPRRLLFTFAKCPTSGRESNYKTEPTLIKEMHPMIRHVKLILKPNVFQYSRSCFKAVKLLNK